MKLNCDLGEGYGSWAIGLDSQAMPLINMANIACGFHASDADIMSETVALAIQNNVSIGAHPGYNDKQGFGRRSIPHTSEQITNLVIYQTGALQAICKHLDSRVDYIKPHGALYNDMMDKIEIFEAILIAAAGCMETPTVMILAQPSNKKHQHIAQQYGIKLLYEAFADRAYTNEGKLTSRSIKGSVYHDEKEIIRQVKQLKEQGTVTSIDGHTIKLMADTICVHGDNEASLRTLKQIRIELDNG
jgi:UPF0271 protein